MSENEAFDVVWSSRIASAILVGMALCDLKAMRHACKILERVVWRYMCVHYYFDHAHYFEYLEQNVAKDLCKVVWFKVESDEDRVIHVGFGDYSSMTHLRFVNCELPSLVWPELPPTTTHLILGDYHNGHLNTLPATVKSIEFGEYYNAPIDVPSTVQKLSFGWCFNQSIDNLPSELTHLTLGCSFNKTVDRLPSSLTHLTFGNRFNQAVDHLPQGLIYLSLGYDFAQKVDRLPPKLTHLIFGGAFRKSIDLLPPTLTHLNLGLMFNRKVNQWPRSLTHLTLSCDFNQPINDLPASIVNFRMGNRFNQSIMCLANTKLEHLTLGVCFLHKDELKSMPPTLTSLKYQTINTIDTIDLPRSIRRATRVRICSGGAEVKVDYLAKDCSGSKEIVQ